MSEVTPVAVQYITFRLADKLLASPLSGVEEVSDPLPVTSIAATHSWFQGLASKNGRLVAVTDLGDYALQAPSRFQSGAKWLILSHEAETIGLVVDEVIGLTEADAADTETLVEPAAAGLKDSPLEPLVTHAIRRDAGGDQPQAENPQTAAVLDLGRLLTQQQFVRIGVAAP